MNDDDKALAERAYRAKLAAVAAAEDGVKRARAALVAANKARRQAEGGA